jgi:L-fucose isomerase-like protein
MKSAAKVAFVVFGVHKDGLCDPLGTPFIDEALIGRSAAALEAEGLELDVYPVVLSTKEEARSCLRALKVRDDIDALVLFAGTWVWAAHLAAALRDFAASGKGIVLWTHPGSQGWRPVGGLVMHGALREIGIRHRFVYAGHDDQASVRRIVSWCRASRVLGSLAMTTVGVFGGRGMGQTCGSADPSQWMRVFGIDIDTRDSAELVPMAEAMRPAEVDALRARMEKHFTEKVPRTPVADRSIRLLGAIEAFVARERWDAYAIQSFPGIASSYAATCLAQSMMLEWGTPTSTLGDMNTLLTVSLLMRLGRAPVYYGDLQHVETAPREVKIIGDGACPPSLAGSVGPARFAEHGIPTEGEAGGISVDLVCRSGTGALARLGRAEGAFEMVVCRCRVFEPDAAQIAARRAECHIPFWPHAFITVECDAGALVQAWNNEYAVLGYGDDLYAEISDFCELAGIRLVAL